MNDIILGIYTTENIRNELIKSFQNEVVCLTNSSYKDRWGEYEKNIRLSHTICPSNNSNEKILENAIHIISSRIVHTVYEDLIETIDNVNNKGLKYTPNENFDNLGDFNKFTQSFRENITFQKYKEIKTNPFYKTLPEYFLFGINCMSNKKLQKYIIGEYTGDELYTNYKPQYLFHGSYDIDSMLLLDYHDINHPKYKHIPYLFLIKNRERMLYDVKIRDIDIKHNWFNNTHSLDVDLSYSKIHTPMFNFKLNIII